MKEIPLTNSPLFALVDDEDFENALGFTWRLGDNGYIITSVGPRSCVTTVRLHNLIMPAPDGFIPDHKNRNKRDNQKSNLRLATHTQNAQNMSRRLGVKSSVYKGVTWDKSRNKWKAGIGIAYGFKHLGRFDDPLEAALAYNIAANKYCGDFACINEFTPEELAALREKGLI